MGNPAAVHDDDRFHDLFWQFCQNPLRWHSLPDLFIHGNGPLGFLRCCIEHIGQIHAHQWKYDFEDLLSAHHRTAGICISQPGRFCHCFCLVDRNDVLLPHHSHHSNGMAAALSVVGDGDRHGRGVMVLCIIRHVS